MLRSLGEGCQEVPEQAFPVASGRGRTQNVGVDSSVDLVQCVPGAREWRLLAILHTSPVCFYIQQKSPLVCGPVASGEPPRCVAPWLRAQR